jgi:hypothetical protein
VVGLRAAHPLRGAKVGSWLMRQSLQGLMHATPGEEAAQDPYTGVVAGEGVAASGAGPISPIKQFVNRKSL